MNGQHGIPLSYICISLFLSGFAFYSLIKFIYFYLNTRRSEVLYFILFGASAFLYIAGDVSAVIFYMATSSYETARVFLTVRELSTLMFVVAVPYMAGQIISLKNRLLKVNNYLLMAGIMVSAAIFFITLYSPESLTGTPCAEINGNYLRITAIRDIRPLMVFKNILLLASLVYAISLLLYAKITSKAIYPVTKVFISLILLSYFILSGFFYIFFFRGNPGYVSFYFPYISTGISLFLLLNTFSLIDILVDYSRKLIKIENELIRVVYVDSDTGIKNRNGFINDLQMELLSGGSLSLIFIDIDDFQNINESFGEKTGDEILKLFTGRLLEFFSSEGELYRVGGDDFVFVLDEARHDEWAVNFASKIISSLRNPFSLYGVSHMLTVSIGVVQVPRDGDSVDTILTNAYSVIRSAKQTKNTCRVFSGEMSDYTSKRISMVNLLRTCISMDRFELYYQPVVDAEGNLVYAESLLRCMDTDPSIGGPDEFIPLLEKAGLIRDIDDMVIRKAFHDMEMRIKKRFGISINLSSNQLIDPFYSDFLSRFAEQHGIDTGMITLEVIESTLIENLSAGCESILRLKEKGFKIAIDDFGKGFSSLSYLSELPVDILKIDMAFVRSIPGDYKKEAIAAHIMNLAHSLDLEVVAEGFENREQFEFFRKLGCDNFQGYYFSRPVPLDELLGKYSG